MSVSKYYSRVATKNYNQTTESILTWITSFPHSSYINSSMQVFSEGSLSFIKIYNFGKVKLYKLIMFEEFPITADLLIC